MEFGTNIRQSTVNGTFYPSDKRKLSSMIDLFFSNSKHLPLSKNIKALIVPHAGYIYSGQTAAWGYRQILQSGHKNFVLIGPSHYSDFNGLACSSASIWTTPLGDIKHKSSSQKNIQVHLFDQPHIKEHSLEVQLPFLQKTIQRLTISCFLTGFHFDVISAAEFFLETYSRSFFIVSSDLSHYLPQDEAIRKDKKTINAILKEDGKYLLSEENIACGLTGILILLQMAKMKKWKGKLIYYDTSYSTSQDANGVVGYSSIGFYK